MGGWTDKVSVNELLLFCEVGKTREQISEFFGLSPAESWSAAKYLSKLTSDVIVEKNHGLTHRAYFFKTRVACLKNIKK